MDDSIALWQNFKRSGDPKAREALITRYVGLAKLVVDRLNIRESGCLSRDDLIGHAIVGLIDAIERYDPSRGFRFETYAIARIRGAVIDMLRSLDWAPRSLRRTEAAVRDAYAKVEGQLGRPATDEEIAAALEISVDDFHRVLADIGQTAVMSLDDCIQSSLDDESRLTLSGLLEDAPDPAVLAEIEEQKRMLADAIGRLPERERLVIGLYYFEGLTLKEIGRVLEVTEARVSQIHTKAVLRLGATLQRHKPVFCS